MDWQHLKYSKYKDLFPRNWDNSSVKQSEKSSTISKKVQDKQVSSTQNVLPPHKQRSLFDIMAGWVCRCTFLLVILGFVTGLSLLVTYTMISNFEDRLMDTLAKNHKELMDTLEANMTTLRKEHKEYYDSLMGENEENHQKEMLTLENNMTKLREEHKTNHEALMDENKANHQLQMTTLEANMTTLNTVYENNHNSQMTTLESNMTTLREEHQNNHNATMAELESNMKKLLGGNNERHEALMALIENNITSLRNQTDENHDAEMSKMDANKQSLTSSITNSKNSVLSYMNSVRASLTSSINTNRQWLAAQMPRTCEDVRGNGNPRQVVHLNTGYEVICDSDTNGGGWLVFQRRESSAYTFEKSWNDYKRGFGSRYGTYWAGFDTIRHVLKMASDAELWIEITYNGNAYAATYSSFSIGDEASNYTLTVSGYKAAGRFDAGDQLSGYNGQSFHTYDKDNAFRCSSDSTGGWWYLDSANCHTSNLNGKWGSTDTKKGIMLNGIPTTGSATYTEMKFRLKYS